MPQITVHVAEEDLALAREVRGPVLICPIELALGREWGHLGRWTVGQDSLYLNGYPVPMPYAARRLQAAWDEGHDGYPVAFEVSV